ncbi:MAG TPA: flagellar motor switch protein FliG [Myxococcales bacterium]|nr:flagellar motor switch protein FliG [Myxococcales bacterium]
MSPETANLETQATEPMNAMDTQVQDDVREELTVSGDRKAAIILVMLGEEVARDILREMSDEEVESLLTAASELRNVDGDEAETVLDEYLGFLEGRALLVPQVSSFVRAVAQDTLSSERAANLLGLEDEDDGEQALVDESASPEAVAQVLRKEHPQTIAIALAAMPTDKASGVISKLPKDAQAGIIKRIAELKSVTPALLREIGETLRRELEASAAGSQSVNGQDLVVSLLKQLSPEQEEHIFNSLSEDDPELSEEIRKKMFVFEDFVTLDGRAIQLMLKEIDSRTLTMALKTSSSPLREHLLSCMSSRAATMILEDLEALGPVAVSQVESAQEEIVQVALRLASEGKLSLR